MRHRRSASPSELERGSVTITVAVVMAAVLLIVGLVIDGSAQLRAGQRADQTAREAARAAGQQFSGDPILGRPGLVDASRARAAAQTYLKTAGVSGHVTVNGGTVQITTSISYQSPISGRTGTVTGQAEISALQVFEGGQR